MKLMKQYIYSAGIGLSLLALVACEEKALVFPEQVEVPEVEVTESGPVKQGELGLILLDDEKVKFDLTSVDQERIASLFFSFNKNGEKVDTEVSDFGELYIIENLPVGSITEIEVWAVGHNGLVSKRAQYKVNPNPYPASKALNNVTVLSGVLSGKLKVVNVTGVLITLYYKLDSEVDFKEAVIPVAAYDEEFSFTNLPIGQHTVHYYFTDETGGTSATISTDFQALASTLMDKTGMEVEVSSVETNEGADNGKGSSLIDGNISTYWHSTWSSGNNPVYPHWFIVDLKKECLFESIEMIRRHNNTGGGFNTFKVEYSVDRSSWNILATDLVFNSTTTPATWQKYSFEPVTARYVRITALTSSGGSTSTHLAEINVYEAK